MEVDGSLAVSCDNYIFFSMPKCEVARWLFSYYPLVISDKTRLFPVDLSQNRSVAVQSRVTRNPSLVVRLSTVGCVIVED